MAEWRVKLQGEIDDLRDLSQLLTGAELNIVENDDAFYLNSAAFEPITEASDMRVQVQRHLDSINGAAKLQFGSFAPVGIGGIARVDEHGKVTHYLFAEGVLFSRGRMGVANLTVTTASGEVLPPPPTFIEAATAAANQHEVVADALRFFLDSNWVNLFKVYELIEEDLGGSKAIVTRFQGITSAQIDRFTGSANNRNASGDGARHGHKKWPSPKKPMSLQEAESFIRGLLDQWIRSK